MNRKWIHFIGISILLVVLAGCGKTVDEQISAGVASSEAAFEKKTADANTEVGNIKVYVPEGYVVDEGTNEMNYIFSKGKDSYILFMNMFEAEDSELHYDNLKNDSSLKVIKEEKFETAGTFGFTAVVEHSEKEYELIVSSGGVKMTTITAGRKIDAKLAQMTEIVLSAETLEHTKG